MIIGGLTNNDIQPQLTDDIELVSPDGAPIPDCLTNLDSFPSAIWGAAGAAMASSMYVVLTFRVTDNLYFLTFSC